MERRKFVKLTSLGTGISVFTGCIHDVDPENGNDEGTEEAPDDASQATYEPFLYSPLNGDYRFQHRTNPHEIGGEHEGSWTEIKTDDGTVVVTVESDESFDETADLDQEPETRNGYEIYRFEDLVVGFYEDENAVIEAPSEENLVSVLETVSGEAEPITQSNDDMDALVNALGDADLVEGTTSPPPMLDTGVASGEAVLGGDENQIEIKYVLVYPEEEEPDTKPVLSYIASELLGLEEDADIRGFEGDGEFGFEVIEESAEERSAVVEVRVNEVVYTHGVP